MSKFYNVLLATECFIDKFLPKIPSLTLESENCDIERICLSKSIEGCLSAVPWGGIHLEDNLNDDGELEIYVHEFDRKDIAKDNLIQPNILFRKDWVRDAMLTKEYWVINQELIPSKIYKINLKDYDENVKDDLSYNDLQAYKRGKDYYEVWNGEIHTLITDIKYDIVDIIK